MEWVVGERLFGHFPLPLDEEIDESGHVIVNVANATLVFRDSDRVLRYYTQGDVHDDWVLCHYPAEGWLMELRDSGDLSWIPAVGCDWWFFAQDLEGNTLVDTTGRLEVVS